MLSVLLKKQLTEIFRNYFYNPKTNKARSKAAVAAYIVLFAVLMVVILGGMFTVLSAALCTPLTAAGLDWLYFALMALLATLLGAFGSVFNTYSGLYLAKDNDLLLSMPIPVNTLMASRLLGVYLMGLMYSGVVMLPAVIVYWVATPAPAAAVIGGVLLVFLLSVFVLALSCALGWLVAKISQKLKNKSFITVVLSLAFFGAYYFFYFKAEDLLQELLRSAAVYGARIKGAALGAEAGAYLSVMLTAALCMLAAMNDMAAPSVSLEGKSLWLLQSLPVTPWQVLRAKLRFQLLLTAIPMLVCLVCAVIALPMAAAETALMAVLSLLFVVFSALLGLTLGLKMPHLHWTSELAPIKQSACVAITLLGGWGYALVLLFGFLLAGQHLGAAAYMGIFAVLTLLACVWLYRWLKKKGVVVFAAL